MKRPLPFRAVSLALAAAAGVLPVNAQAFCGFFVARADAKLFNSASQVVIVHEDDNTILTMVNDYRGEPRSFALVVPVPIVLEKELVRVVSPKVVQRVDAFSAPRLAEYFDSNPCERERYAKMEAKRGAAAPAAEKSADKADRDRALGVTVLAEYTVGEYDIVILSALESNGLETWLRENQYNIPKGASAALAPYIRSEMKFFVAKVNLKELAKSGATSLRPLQFAFTDKRFMLPIRLGMLNADGPQDLVAYVITKQFRVEPTNYRSPKIASNVEIPTFIKTDFATFYRDLFRHSVDKESGRAVFTEHAWNMGWCDPCADDPLTKDELEELGVWWLDAKQGQAQQAFITRLHARYTPETFPEDLMLKVTKDSANFQARYVLRHPWTGNEWCEAMEPYVKGVEQRREREMQTLASLTGWSIGDIRKRMVPMPITRPDQVKDKAWSDRVKQLFQKQPK
jgi:hypothetical protein